LPLEEVFREGENTTRDADALESPHCC
jgi:hypothetical protein